jgi:hypothetical protein
MMHGSLYPSDYDVEKLREVAGVNDEDEGEDEPDPNYKCQVCDNHQYVDDYQNHTPAWCHSCERIKTFVNIKYRESEQ